MKNSAIQHMVANQYSIFPSEVKVEFLSTIDDVYSYEVTILGKFQYVVEVKTKNSPILQDVHDARFEF
jgi:hypothetical protein